MTIQPGTRLGPYEIVSPLGAGGMGEVFRARDTRLDRSVAIKVLPAEFAENVSLKARFEREAKTISQLEHPHICRLYDVGEEIPVGAHSSAPAASDQAAGVAGALLRAPADSSSVSFLVMELLEGETLTDRLARGPLPIEQVFKLGIEIASALDRAHRAGVVHRDLKPGNIMLTKSGAKLLDFGLAKNAAGAISTPDAPTEQQKEALTAEGTIIGTFQYMAPEQLEGHEADARTDIFALGVVLYEAATGRHAFEGRTRTSLIASIVAAEPKPMSQVRPTPLALEHVVSKCLEKEPDERWQNVHDVAQELRWIAEGGGVEVAQPGMSRSRTFALGVAVALLAIACGLLAWLLVRGSNPSQPLIRASMIPPEGVSIQSFDWLGAAISPDGRMFAFAADAADGRRQLWLRRLDQPSAQLIPESGDGQYPFWSPDSRYLGFFAEGKLKTFDVVRQGSPEVLAEAPSGRGGTWSAEGVIVFAPRLRSGLYRVSASGGAVTPVLPDDAASATSCRWPHFLPDGKHVLFVTGIGSASESGHLKVIPLTGGKPETLLQGATNAVYVEPGYLVYGRRETLLAQRFDATKRTLTGTPFALIPEKVSYFRSKDMSVFSISSTGTLVYQPSTPLRYSLTWKTRTGQEISSAMTIENVADARLSPDGKWIAFTRNEAERSSVWLLDVQRKTERRVLSETGRFQTLRWSPDGAKLLLGWNRGRVPDVPDLYVKELSGGSLTLAVKSDLWKIAGGFLPDGAIIYGEQSATTKYDLWAAKPGGQRKALVQTTADESWPEVSADGRWIAYQSNETGRTETHVSSAMDERHWQASTSGSVDARWRSDGRELHYTDPQGKVFALPIGSDGQPGSPAPLFVLPRYGWFVGAAPDGSGVLIADPSSAETTSRFEVIFNTRALFDERQQAVP